MEPTSIPDRWRRAEEIFHAALERPATERPEFVREVTDGDSALRAEVDSLLRAHDEGSTFLKAPLAPPGEALGAAEVEIGPEPQASTLPPADALPGYQILREIQHGGQGIVYEALQESTRRKVALKVLIEGPFADAARKRRFEHEVEAAARLHHPNVVRIYDSGVSEGFFFYAMEYVRGERLDAHVRSRRLSVLDTLRLFKKVLDGVAHAHQNGVIHRDLKPANVLVDEDGEPKVLDFGLAKVSAGQDGEPAAAPSVSVPGLVLGTWEYMSPEQAGGRLRDADTRSDVYSLGAILYELLTGVLPYDLTGSIAEKARTIQEVGPRRPRSLRPEIGDELETILLKALSKERERRYASASALADDLGRYFSGEPIDAKRDSTLYLLRKALRRHRAPVAFAASILLLLVASSAVAWFLYARAERALSREARLRAETEALSRKDRFELLRGQVRTLLEGGETKVRSLIPDFIGKARPLGSGVQVRSLAVELLGAWDAAPLKLESVIVAPGGNQTWSVSMSAKGDRLAAGVPGGAVIWDLPSGERLTPLEDRTAEGNEGNAVQLNADGTRLAVEVAGEKIEVRDVTNARSPKVIETLPGFPLLSQLAFSSDGRFLAAVSNPALRSRRSDRGRTPRARVWDLGASPAIHVWEGGDVLCVAFSPGGRALALGRKSGSVDFLDLASSGAGAPSLRGPQGDIQALAWDPRGELLAAGSVDSLIILWDMETRQSLHRWPAHPYGVRGLAFGPGGEWLASAGWNQAPTFWDTASGKRMFMIWFNSPPNVLNYTRALALAADGLQVAFGGDAGLAACRVLPPIGQWKRSAGPMVITRAAFDGTSKHLATLDSNWRIHVWSAESGRLLAKLRAKGTGFADNAGLAFSPSGRRMACACYSGHTDVWDWASGRTIGSWSLQGSGLVPRVAFRDEDELLLLRHERGGTPDEQWEIRTYRLVPGREPEVLSRVRSPGTSLYDGGGIHAGRFHAWIGPRSPPHERKLRLVDITEGREVDAVCLPGLAEHDVNGSVPWFESPDGRLLVQAAVWGSVDREKGPVCSLFEVRPEGLRIVREWRCAVDPLPVGAPNLDGRSVGTPSPDGRWLAVRTGAGAMLWDVASEQALVEFQVGVERPSVLALSPDGRLLACGTGDGTVAVFDLGTLRRELAKLRLDW